MLNLILVKSRGFLSTKENVFEHRRVVIAMSKRGRFGTIYNLVPVSEPLGSQQENQNLCRFNFESFFYQYGFFFGDLK